MVPRFVSHQKVTMPIFLHVFCEWAVRPQGGSTTPWGFTPWGFERLPHMAIEGVLTRQKSAETPATFWDPVPPDLVALNCDILNFHDF